MNISVLDSGGFKADTLIVASVEDVNDHSPVFSKDVYEFRIPEGELSFTLWYNLDLRAYLFNVFCLNILGTYGRTKLGEVLASDGDLGSNAEVFHDS